MAGHSVQIKYSALKALRRIDKPHRARLISAIDRLAVDPHAGGVLKGEFAGLRRIRVGHYRIVYEVHEGRLVVLVIRIAHRGKVHR